MLLGHCFNRVLSGNYRKMGCLSKTITVALLITAFGFVLPSWSQNIPADNMEILRARVQKDKKLLVSKNMGLTASEGRLFWPIYEEYQVKLQALNRRIRRLLESYAKAYNSKSLTDAKARELLKEYISIETDEAKLKGAYIPKLNMVLPAKKVARYIQLENKIRAAFDYDLAAKVPLVQ